MHRVAVLVSADAGLMKDDQRGSLHSHVCVTPCRPAGASQLCAGFAQHNLLVAFHSHLIHSLTNAKKNSIFTLFLAQTTNTEGVHR